MLEMAPGFSVGGRNQPCVMIYYDTWKIGHFENYQFHSFVSLVTLQESHLLRIRMRYESPKKQHPKIFKKFTSEIIPAKKNGSVVCFYSSSLINMVGRSAETANALIFHPIFHWFHDYGQWGGRVTTLIGSRITKETNPRFKHSPQRSSKVLLLSFLTPFFVTEHPWNHHF